MSYQDTDGDSPAKTFFATVTGSGANTQVQTTITVPSSKVFNLSLIFQAVSGGNFASQSATCEVSNDNSTFYTVDSTINLGTGTLFAKGYSNANLGTTLAVNPATFKFIRVTIPAIVGITTRVLWSIK